jgi:putative membrane protein
MTTENTPKQTISKEQDLNYEQNPFSLFLIGFCIGAANIVPGVSGGTIALLAGIYRELISGVKNGIDDAIKLLPRFRIQEFISRTPWTFFISLGVGLVTATFTLSAFLEHAISNFPVTTWSFFFGLIVASIVIVAPRIESFNAVTVSGFLIGAIGSFFLLGLIPVQTPSNYFFYFLSGAIAISAMILPGLSGSFILLLLGKYSQVLDAVTDVNIPILVAVGLGAVVGLGAFSHILNYIFSHYKDLTLSILIGIMLGSLRKVWPWRETLETYIDSDGVTQPLVERNLAPDSFESIIITCIMFMLAIVIVVSFDSLQYTKSTNS